MKPIQAVRGLFVIAGFYDGVLGLTFLLAAPAIFHHFGIAPPNHPGYVQFPALLLIVFACMFFAVAAHPAANRNLILYGILLKLSYSGVVIYNWLAGGVPSMWKPFVFIDLVFIALFAWSIAAIPAAPQAD